MNVKTLKIKQKNTTWIKWQTKSYVSSRHRKRGKGGGDLGERAISNHSFLEPANLGDPSQKLNYLARNNDAC